MRNKIGEDGIFGPRTASALDRAPCHGWANSFAVENLSLYEMIEDPRIIEKKDILG